MTTPGPTSGPTSTSSPGPEPRLDLGGVPASEGVDPADAAERLDKDPAEQGHDADRQEPDIVVDDVEASDG